MQCIVCGKKVVEAKLLSIHDFCYKISELRGIQKDFLLDRKIRGKVLSYARTGKNPIELKTIYKMYKVDSKDTTHWFSGYRHNLKECLLKNPNTPSDILEDFWKEERTDWRVTSYLPMHSNISKHLFELFLEQGDTVTLRKLADNKGMKALALVKIYNAVKQRNVPRRHNIFFRLVYNKNAPSDLLEKFRDSDDESVLCGVVHNSNTPIHVLKHLQAKFETSTTNKYIAMISYQELKRREEQQKQNEWKGIIQNDK